MNLERWFTNLESRVFGCLCPPETQPHEAAPDIDKRLAERQASLKTCRNLIQEVGVRVRETENRINLLSCKARLCLLSGEREAAWQHSLELEELRGQLEADRSRLSQLHHARRNHEAELNRLTRQRASHRGQRV